MREDIGLRKWQNEDSLQQQNEEKQQNDDKPSIETLFQLESSGESSTGELGFNAADGVHTDGEISSRGANDRNVNDLKKRGKGNRKKSNFSKSKNDSRNPKYTDTWIDEKSGQKKHVSAGRGNDSE